MISWTALKSLIKLNYQKNKIFYSISNNEHITNDQYNHAQYVWNKFNLKSMGEYQDLYLKSDILLLAYVFETLQKHACSWIHVIIFHHLVLVGTLC